MMTVAQRREYSALTTAESCVLSTSLAPWSGCAVRSPALMSAYFPRYVVDVFVVF